MHRLRGLYTALALGMMLLCSVPSSAQSPSSLSDSEFERAFRDEEHIFSRGSFPLSREEQLLAQEAAAPGDELKEEETGGDSGVSRNVVHGVRDPLVFDGGSNRTYRVADLAINCGIEFCRNPENVEALLRATGLSLGRTASRQELALSIERLRKTGYFSNIHQKLVYAGEHVNVQYDVEGHLIIRKVTFGEKGNMYEAELRKRMILRPGGVLYPRTALLRGREVDNISREELTRIAIEDQKKSLKRIYTKEGYLDADIQVEVIPVEESPELVDLRVSVDHAYGYALGKVYVRGHKSKSYAEIESEFRSGFSFFGNATKEQIEDSVNEVLQFYRSDGYFQTRIDFVSRPDREARTLDVFLDITEAPRNSGSPKWVVEYSGNVSLNAKELNEHLTFASSGYVDGAEVAASAEALRKLYVSAGYYWAKVRGEIIRSAGGQPNVIRMTIEEGPHTEIGSIQFDGALAMSRSELLDVISSREYSAFGSGAYPQRSMIADDAAKIVDAYRERGYLNADVSRWELRPDRESGRLALTFIIHEGEISRLAHRQIRYADRAQFENYDVLIDKPESDTFSDYALRAERAAISKQLRARGYATISDRIRCVSYYDDGSIASMETCEIAEFPSSCFPEDPVELCEFDANHPENGETCQRHYSTQYNDANGDKCVLTNGLTGQIIDVEYEVKLGPLYTFGDVFTHGNVFTRDWVVHQDIPIKKDEAFDYNRIMEARTLLRQRSIYNSATLNIIGVDDGLITQSENADSTGTTEYSVPIVVNLEEARRRWFDFALGISLSSDNWILTAEMEYVEANLLGLGWNLSFLVMPEIRFFKGDEFVIAQKFNQNFFALMSLTIPLLPSKGLDLVGQLFYDLRYIPETNKEEGGGLVEIQWNINQSWFAALAMELKTSQTSSFSIDVSDDLATYDACYPVTFFMKCPFTEDKSSATLSITPRASYDGRDAPLSPKYGVYAEGKIKLALSNNAGFYIKPDFRVSYVYTFLKYFTLGMNLRVGMSLMQPGKTLPLIDRFFLGGLSMRGYDNDALGPRLVNELTPNVATNEAAGGEALFNFNLELRFPIWNSMGIFAAVFTDMGSIVAHDILYYGAGDFFKEMFVDEMHYTAGLGLRWLISESIPPIVIDYGFILNRRHGDPIGRFSLNVGYTF